MLYFDWRCFLLNKCVPRRCTGDIARHAINHSATLKDCWTADCCVSSWLPPVTAFWTTLNQLNKSADLSLELNHTTSLDYQLYHYFLWNTFLTSPSRFSLFCYFTFSPSRFVESRVNCGRKKFMLIFPLGIICFRSSKCKILGLKCLSGVGMKYLPFFKLKILLWIFGEIFALRKVAGILDL